MNYAYDELYLPLAQRVMGDMYDYAVNTLNIVIQEFHKMFTVSGMAHQFEIGNPTYIAGKNGCEVAKEVISECTDMKIEAKDAMYVDKTPEYWIGWSLSYYQWITCKTYREIEEHVPIETMYGMYATLHEADISLYVEIMDEKFQIERSGGYTGASLRYRMYGYQYIYEKRDQVHAEYGSVRGTPRGDPQVHGSRQVLRRR